MYCSKCGTKLQDEACFCSSCGEKVKNIVESCSEEADQGNLHRNNEDNENPSEPIETVTIEQKTIEQKTIEQMQEQDESTEALETPQYYVPDKKFSEMFLPWVSSTRLNRLRYFKRSLVVSAASLLLGMIILMGGGLPALLNEKVVMITDVITIPFQYWLDVRRLKDLGQGKGIAKFRAFCILASWGLIWRYGEKWEIGATIVSILVLLYLLLAPGTKGVNQYGADPLEPMSKQA